MAVEQTFLQEIPTLQSAKVAHVYKGDQVIAVFRDEPLHWMNVIYKASTNNSVVGWIRLSELSDLRCGEREVNLIDVPISNFDWYTREQVNDVMQQRLAAISMLKEKLKSLPKFHDSFKEYEEYSTVFIVPFVGAILTGGFLLLMILDFFSSNSLAFGFMPFLIAFVLFIICIRSVWHHFLLFIKMIRNRVQIRKNDDLKNEPLKNQATGYTNAISSYEAEVVRLKRIIQMKKPEQEKMMEAQIKVAAINTAMDLGSGLIKRLVPNKQEVIYRDKRN